MRPIVLLLFALSVVACEVRAQDPAAAGGAGGSSGAAAVLGGGGGLGLLVDGGENLCDCLPDCTTDTTAVEAELCSDKGGSGWLAIRTTYRGCDDVVYSSVTWDFSLSYLVKDGRLEGCGAGYTLTRDPLSTWTGAVLDPTCEAGAGNDCSPCRDNADPTLRENAPPACE